MPVELFALCLLRPVQKAYWHSKKHLCRKTWHGHGCTEIAYGIGNGHRRMRYIHSARCACYGLRKLCCCVLGIVYANERTNERTNDYAPFERFVKYLRLFLCNLCYFVLRKRCMIMERNTVCATVLFHGYYYNLLSGRFQPLGEVLIGNGYQLSRRLPIIH